MATSSAHRFGQIIGDLLEEIMAPQLAAFCKKRGLYLDKKGQRGKARRGKKVTWQDKFGNNHDLDFVIEKGGSKDVTGRPLAFIEVAWRRYTKHSRNKAQEIQGALLPIAEKYGWDRPFLGAILAGEFTDNSLAQMKSSGFDVMLFPYETIVSAFGSVGIDAQFDESTPDAAFQISIDKIGRLSDASRQKLKQNLLAANEVLLAEFLERMGKALDRRIDTIVLIPLHGKLNEFTSVTEAIAFIEQHDPTRDCEGGFRKYEVVVRYNNGDKIDATFADKNQAIAFLTHVGSA